MSMTAGAELVGEFEHRLRRKMSEKTVERYRKATRYWVDWLENPGSKAFDANRRNRQPIEVWEAEGHHLENHLGQMVDHGYAGGTVEGRKSAITKFYSELEGMAKQGVAPEPKENPGEEIDVSDWSVFKKGTKKQQESKEDQYLEPEEVRKMANSVPSPTLRNILLIKLLYMTGLRRQEMVQTDIEDIDRDARTINVRATKTHENRTVGYQPELDSEMNRWLNVERKALAHSDSDALFPTNRTDRMSGQQINHVVKTAAENAGVQEEVYNSIDGVPRYKVTAHVLRHSFAVQCVKNDMDVRRLQMLLGHSEIEMTEKYLRFDDKDAIDEIRSHGPTLET